MSSIDSQCFVEAAERVSRWRRPLLVTHAKPDGDALGSLVALHAVLREQGADPLAVIYDPIPGRYNIFRKYDSLVTCTQKHDSERLSTCDGIIVVDTCTYNQLSPIVDWLRESTLGKLVVDHHVTRDNLADAYLVDESAAAACQILFDWFRTANWTIPTHAVEALFMGLAMDTGWFRHSNTNDRVLSIASELVVLGAKPHLLYQSLFQRETPARIRLVGVALGSLQLACRDQLAVMSLTSESMRSVGATPADTEDIVNEPLRIDATVVSILLVETDDCIRVSFRSQAPDDSSDSAQIQASDDARPPDVDVAAVAQAFGGGGHRRAAGARVKGSLSEVRDSIIENLSQHL